MSNTKILFNGLSAQTLVTIVLALIEMSYFAIMSRLLTKTDFGYYAAITGVMAIITSLSEAGLGASVIQKKDATEMFISTAYSLSIILGLVFCLLLFILSPLIANLIADDTLEVPLRIIAVTVLLNSMNSCGNAVLYRKFKFKTIGVNSIISYLLSSIVGVTLAYLGYGLISVVLYSVCFSLFTFLLLYVFNVKIPKLLICKDCISSIVGFGGWLTLSTLANNIMHQVDKIILPKLLSVEILGAYNRPSGFINTISSKINGIFDTVLFPILSSLQDDKSKVKNVFYRSIKLLNSISIILAAGFIFNSDLIITLFFGDDWMDLSLILKILSLSLVFNIDNRLVDCFFRSLNFVKIGFYIRCVGMITMILSLIVGSYFDIVGIAISVVTANILTILIKLVYLCIKIKVSILFMMKAIFISWKPVIPILIIGIPYSIMDYTVSRGVIFLVLFGIIILCEFLLFPSFVSNEYYQTIYLKLNKYYNDEK